MPGPLAVSCRTACGNSFILSRNHQSPKDHTLLLLSIIMEHDPTWTENDGGSMHERSPGSVIMNGKGQWEEMDLLSSSASRMRSACSSSAS